MNPERELQAFLQQLSGEVRDRASGGTEGPAEFKENVFTEILLEYLEEIGMIENALVVFYEGKVGRGIARVNGYAMNDEGDMLDLFTSVFLDAGEVTSIAKDDIIRAASRAARFCEGALRGIHEDMEAASEACSMARNIKEHGPTLERVRLFVLTDGVTSVRQIDDVEEIEGVPVRCELWDIERMFRGMQAGMPRDEISIDFERDHGGALPCLPMLQEAGAYMAYLTIIPGEMLYRLYDEYGSRLLEFNVRSFLSARGKVNSGIRKTLKEEPDRFLAYNNGIVVTADDLDVVTLPDGRPAIKAARGLQVVNGGQTTASIHRAHKTDRADISSVLVPAKITLIDPEKEEEIVRKVSRYANTQNVIQMADFSANEPFHVEVERLSERVWCPGEQGRWFYERARGQYQVAKARLGSTPARARRFKEQTPPARKFTKTDLAKYANSWAQKPQLVSFGAQKNFDHFMQDMRSRYGKDWLPDDTYYRDLISKAILFKAAQKIVRQEQFPAYRANMVTYMIAYLASRSGGHLDLDRIWREQTLSEELTETLRRWSHYINKTILNTARGRNVTEWCKKDACWAAVKGLSLDLPSPLPTELRSRGSCAPGAATTRDGSMTEEDYENIALCKDVDGPNWLKIHAWGKETGHLEKWQYGIAHTLSSYAAGEWTRSPSPKQAKHGVQILRTYREHIEATGSPS